jgi:hypothetical protein
MLTKEKKEQLICDSEAWWNHQLDRSLIQVTLAPSNLPFSRGELLDLCYDYSIPASQVAKDYKENIERTIYLGDAFPQFYMRSTGILGAMLGQGWKISKEHGTIWYQELNKELEDIHFDSNLDNNELFDRGMDLIKAFQDEFGDDIAYGIPNLGGMMDIVESMRGANNCLLDLYDEPEEVLRLNNDIYQAYEKAYKEYIQQISTNNGLGYTGWITLLSQKPYFISQCDFCCMVGHEQFDEFVFDTLNKESHLIDRAFYHLDGPGAVKHLDDILKCDFDGIQWINGAGSEPLDSPKWNEIYDKVHAAGKLLQVYIYGKEELKFIDYIVNYLGTTKDLAFICTGNEEDKEEFIKYLDKYHIPH